MGEIIRPPVEIEVGGQPRIFTPDDTEVRLYRFVTDAVFNHVKSREYGTQDIHLFDVPNLLCFLTGQEVYGHNLKRKQLDKVTEAMDEQVGWSARTVIEDSAPEEIKERYIRLASVALQKEVLYVPKSWSKS